MARDEHRAALKQWVVEALKRKGGRAKLIDVARDLWANHEQELRRMDDLFYTWQYDMRWAATALRKDGIMEPAPRGSGSVWALVR